MFEKGIHLRDDKPYGWVAREDDYNRSGIVGKNVKKKRDLKSISQIQEEDKRKMDHLVQNMYQSIEMKMICKQELELKVDETFRCLKSLALHNVELNKTYQEGKDKHLIMLLKLNLYVCFRTDMYSFFWFVCVSC